MEGNVASAHVNWRVTKIVIVEFCKTFIKESSNLSYPPLNLLSTIALWIPHVSTWKDIFFSIRKQQYLIREGIKKIDFFLGKSPKLWVGGGQES